MSSRFPPVHESRYPPRTRSRSPPRYQEWRPNGPQNPGFNNNRHGDFGRGLDPPRGPKTFNDSPRGPPPGPGTGSSAPLGPRGRGAPPRPEFRELRDAPPLGTDRSFREREFDRRPRPTSPRARSPVRGFRDGPILPRDLDMGRGRRDSRDGPINAGPGYSDAPPFGQPSFGRGGFNGRGRGRGRGDFGFRDRRGPADDRSTFRPRDRSPPTRWGSVSRNDRDDWRPERREDDRWLDRDDREREPERFRRDPATSRFDSRPPTPHQQVPLAQAPAERAPPFESTRDDLPMRRPSTTSLSGIKEPPRRDLPPQNAPPPMPLPPNDLLAGRVESSAARYGSRASSPPPSAPQVPAFGSLSFKSQPYNGPTSNVWKASPENRAPPTPAKPSVPSPPAVKTIPTAPKAQFAAPPPAAPRAPRALENVPPTAPRELPVERAPSVSQARNPSVPQPQVPTGPWALRTDDRPSGQLASTTVREGRSLSGSFQPETNKMPTSPRTLGSGVAQMAQMTPVAPPETSSNQAPIPQTQPSSGNAPDGRAPRADMAPPRLGTPPPSAPSGPRNAHTFSTSPVMQNPNIPTAPKAIRGPPMAPRASMDRGQPLHRPMDRNGLAPSRVPSGAPRAPAWNQWIRPGAPQYRDPTVPAKRDLNGDEKSQQFIPKTSPQNMHRQISDPSSMRADENKDDRAFRTAPVSPERRMSDTNAANKPPFQKEYSVPSPGETVQSDPAVDAELATAESSEEFVSDEEGMDLDEEDFAQSKAKFERQKAHLEAQMIDLNARQFRATTPLEQIARLANITVKDLPIAQESTSTEAKDDVMEGLETSEPAAPAVSQLHPSSPKSQEDIDTDIIEPKKEQIDDAEAAAVPAVPTKYNQPAPDGILDSAEADQNDDIDMEGSDNLDFITPEPKQSIEAITLPYLTKSPLTPLSDLGAFHENIARLNAAKPALIAHYQAQAEEDKSLQKDLHEQYLEKYRAWRLETQLLDRERTNKESEERQMSVELGLDIESSPILENPVSETRSRLHKFSSEYDLIQALKQSEETARLEQEKVERESRRAQIDLEKEAIPPEVWDQASKEKRIFKNMNRYRDPVCLTEIYGYEPEFDTFTETEHKRFVELFKERPKQWGEIAAQLPGRSYADCIHHYYKYKWDGRFKEKTKRRGKGGARRGGKTGRAARGAQLMSDMRTSAAGEDDSSSGPMLTETGRPRRAATRTAYTAEKDPEVKAPAVSTTTNKKVPATGEAGSEKPAKRRKTTAAGDKPQKRGRQTLVSTGNSATSPAATDKEVTLGQEDFARAKQLEDAALLTGIFTGTRAIGGTQHVEYTHDPLPAQVTVDSAERSRAPAQTPMQRSSASSYWSVPEQTDFVKFIAHFGTDFGAIANHMGTKTQTMVKNYYQRLVESGNRPDVVDAANVANARRDRGEDMGVPPTPTPINKRRYDNPGPSLPRTASGSQEEVMDIDPVPPTQPSTLSQPSSQFQHQYRFSMATQPTSAPPQRAAPTPLQQHESPALSKPGVPAQPRASISSAGPKMGFFSESRMERRPTLSSSERPAQLPSPSLMHQQQPTPPGLMHQNLSHLTSEFVKNLKEEQERALSIQKRASQEHVPQVAQHPLFQPLGGQTSAPSGSPQLSMLDRPLERDERSGTPGLPSLAHPRAGPAMFRNILGSPGPMSSPAVTMHPPFRSHVPSPPKREEHPMYRPGSVPVPSPAPSVVKPAMSLTTGPPAEPRKTSNLASLLNSEPEEPRQKKRVSDQPTPFTQSPTPSTLSVAPSGPSSSIFPRREVFNQTPVSRQEFDGRSSYPQPISHAPTPAAQHELMTGRSGTPVGSRQAEWQSRPPVGQNLASSSPHPPAPLERDVRPYFSHHANLGSLNPQSRANPSPPPNTHPYMDHSRTPSIGGRPMTPSQLQPQGPSGLSHMAQAQTAQAQAQMMQSNPYAQPHGASSHMQQMQAHQQNQFSHRHNSSGGSSRSGLHQRQPSRGEEVSMLRQQQQQQQQEREYHMSREREHRMEVDRQYKEREAQAQFQQHQQHEQQRYGQHRTPQPYQQQPLSGPPAQMLSLREQARIEADQSYRDARNREQYEQEMHIRRIQEDEERMRYDYRNSNGMMGRSSGGGYGGFPPPGPHRR